MADGGEGGSAPDAAAAERGNERENASRTFFTSIDATTEVKGKRDRGQKPKYKALEETNAGPRITEHHRDLVNLANTLDERMAALLKEHEKDFFLAYKTHMYTVQKEIKTLRMKADHEEAKTREDTKIKALEGELDWFMTEALRLDELCKGYKKEVDKWKAKAQALDEDRHFLEDQIKGAKRQNKILNAAAERAKSSAYSALMSTQARVETGGYPASPQLALPAPRAPESTLRPRPSSATGAADSWRPAVGAASRRAFEARARTPDPPQRQGLALVPSTSADALALTSGARSSGALPSRGTSTDMLAIADSGAAPHILGNEAEQRYIDAVKHLKESIVREQNNVRMLQAARAAQFSRKSDMEEFFLKCFDEAKKDLMRKKHLTMNRRKSEQEQVYEAVLTNEDLLVCLYEKLFPHRTGIARSLGATSGGGDEIQAAIE